MLLYQRFHSSAKIVSTHRGLIREENVKKFLMTISITIVLLCFVGCKDQDRLSNISSSSTGSDSLSAITSNPTPSIDSNQTESSSSSDIMEQGTSDESAQLYDMDSWKWVTHRLTIEEYDESVSIDLPNFFTFEEIGSIQISFYTTEPTELSDENMFGGNGTWQYAYFEQSSESTYLIGLMPGEEASYTYSEGLESGTYYEFENYIAYTRDVMMQDSGEMRREITYILKEPIKNLGDMFGTGKDIYQYTSVRFGPAPSVELIPFYERVVSTYILQ